MALSKAFTGTDFTSFERDLLSVLKADPDHRIDFDGKLLFRSRQYDCLLAATDVHWDEKSGDIVLVGAFRSGQPVMDETKGYPSMKTSISVPLRECFDDLRLSSGNEMKLVGKAKKAVLDKYLIPLVKLYRSRGMFDGVIMDLPSFGCGEFRLNDCEVIGIAMGGEGKVGLVCSNSFNPNFTVDAGKVSLKEIQNFSSRLAAIGNRFRQASDVYLETMRRVAPLSMSFSPEDNRRHVSAALAAVYDVGFPARVMDCVCRHLAGLDYFDTRVHTRKDIVKMMEDYRNTGIMKPSRKGPGQSLQI